MTWGQLPRALQSCSRTFQAQDYGDFEEKMKLKAGSEHGSVVKYLTSLFFALLEAVSHPLQAAGRGELGRHRGQRHGDDDRQQQRGQHGYGNQRRRGQPEEP